MLLNGYRIVEIGQVLSAPYAGMILADLGAEVIKVEKPGSGDDARGMGSAFRNGASMTFHDVNRGKRSVVLDLKTPHGVDQLFEMLGSADALVHNLRPGEAERLGIGERVVGARFPRLVYCEISAFGHKGPRRLQPGYEPLLQAYGGLISINGHASSPPSRMGASLVDQGTAMWAVIGILTALLRREKTQMGGVVHTSLLETALGWCAPRIHEYLNQGRPSERYGTGHPNLVPYQAFEAADGPLMICAGNDRLFVKLAKVLGKMDWLHDDRFATNRQRVLNRTVVVDAVQDVVRLERRAVWVQRLEAAAVPVAAVNDIAALMEEAQTKALEMVRPVGGEGFVLAGLPMSFDGQRPEVKHAAPALGADDEQYLGRSTLPKKA